MMKRSSRTLTSRKAADGAKRLDAAKRDFQKMQEVLAPFIKRRVIAEHSTAGEWCETSRLCNSLEASTGWQ